MTDILRLIEKYDGLSDDKKLVHPDLAQDITLIQNSMETWSDEDQTKAKEFLMDLANGIQGRIHTIEEELKLKPQALENARKTMEACLAYNKARTKEG
jgi:hypothetical protein